MTTFKDLFLDDPADPQDAEPPIVKASLKAIGADKGLRTRLVRAGSKEEAWLNESGQKGAETLADHRPWQLRRAVHVVATRLDRTSSRSYSPSTPYPFLDL